jgi:hypothetical protein
MTWLAPVRAAIFSKLSRAMSVPNTPRIAKGAKFIALICRMVPPYLPLLNLLHALTYVKLSLIFTSVNKKMQNFLQEKSGR